MQALSLQLCQQLQVDDPCDQLKSFSFDETQVNQLFRNAVAIANCKTAFDIILAGAKTRGSERNIHTLANGQSGDVYFVLLKAIASANPLLSFRYSQLKERVESLVPHDPPRGVGITSTLEQMHKSVQEKLGEDRVLEWDKEKETLDVPDPYFLYYLRWANW